MLGAPAVSDRVAQAVVRLYREPDVEPILHPDSYGYRPGRSALDAVAVCRRRCWGYDWVVDPGVRSFCDSLDHDLVPRAAAQHTHLRWVLLYVERWLKAPLQREDGARVERDRGTPQGSAIPPLLASLLLRHAFDRWMARGFPDVPFERYADDAVARCATEAQAREVLGAIVARLAEVGLEVHPDKARIVYCKDADRTGSAEHERFDFLGCTFRPRLSRSRHGKHLVNFSPAVSDEARKAIGREIRSWRIDRRSDEALTDLARMLDPIVQGWINYYGRFCKSMAYPPLRRLDEHLVRWAMRRCERLRGHLARAVRWLAGVARREPGLFAHWRMGLRPDGWTVGAG